MMNLRSASSFALLFLLAPALFAQELPELSKIQAALNDGLHPLAEQQIWRALSVERTAEEEAELTLLMVRALAGQQKFDDAVTLAEESALLPQQDAFAYWRARALFEKGDFSAVLHAETTRLPLDEIPPDSVYAPAALRLRGLSEKNAGDLRSAQKTFETFQEQFPEDEHAAQNLLDLSEVYLQRDNRNASIKILYELLERFPGHPLANQTRLELARRLIVSSHEKDRTEAAEVLHTLGSDEAAAVRLRIAAWVELAAFEQRAARPAKASEALAKAGLLTGEAALRARQKAIRAGLLIEDNKSKEAFVLFDEALKEAPDAANAADVQLLRAEALLKTGQYSAAEKAFQTCLDVTTDPALQIQALTGRGWSLWEQKRFEESAVDFENVAVRCTDKDLCVTALLKAGDARLAAGQHEKARAHYNRIVETAPDHPSAGRAMYQSGVASLLAGQTGPARAAFARTETGFPESGFAARAALQLADLFKREQQWMPALYEYRRVAAQYPDAAVRSTAIHQQGLILYRLGRWDAALEAFRAVSDTYADSPEAPQALYMRGFCRYMQGDTEAALALCQSFIEKHPDSVWTPEVLFWTAEHHYNRGDYTRAHSVFLDIAARFPKHELSDTSLFWAGNALIRQADYLNAFTLFSRLAGDYPASPLLLRTRFAQGEALTSLGEFPRAILAYQEVIKTAPDDPLADRARGRLADCLFTLGTTESGRYQEALEAYQALYKRPSVPFDLKLQTLYKIARCEDRLGLKEKAFARYIETVYSADGRVEPLSPEAALWFTRAVFDAAEILEKQQQWSEAVNLYKRMILAGVPAASEAQKRIDRIEREHASVF